MCTDIIWQYGAKRADSQIGAPIVGFAPANYPTSGVVPSTATDPVNATSLLAYIKELFQSALRMRISADTRNALGEGSEIVVPNSIAAGFDQEWSNLWQNNGTTANDTTANYGVPSFNNSADKSTKAGLMVPLFITCLLYTSPSPRD